MSLVGGWLLAPLVLGAVFCGMGLLVERAAGIRLPGALIPGVGLMTMIVLVSVLVSFTATAPLAVPATAAATAAGIVVGRPWQSGRLRRAVLPLALAVAVFGLFAAPSLLSGQGSVPGYVKLDDPATWIATIDRALDHGRDVDVSPGSYGATLEGWLGVAYPIGGFVPLGVAARLSGQDPVNAYAPAIAVLAAIVALGLYAVATTLIRSRALAAGAALVAVQASVFVGYAMWGGIKEVCIAALLPVGAWTAVRTGRSARHLLLAILAAAAIFAVLGANGVVWAGPVLATGAFVAWRNGLRSPVAAVALAALLVVALLPVLTSLDFVRQTTVGPPGTLGDASDLGNLVRPLPVLQAAGLWPVGDFRLHPSPYGLAALLAVAGIGAATFACSLAVSRSRWSLPVLLGITLVGTVVTARAGSPWVTAKAIAVTAPMLLLAGAMLVGMGIEDRSAAARLAAAGGSAILLAGCAWSTLAVARDVYVAPRGRLGELKRIGQLVAARGPTLQTDFDVYGDRWFLRNAQADGASDLRARNVRTAEGVELSDLASVDTDALLVGDLEQYRTIVRRLSPTSSRPPGQLWHARSGCVLGGLDHEQVGLAPDLAARARRGGTARLAPGMQRCSIAGPHAARAPQLRGHAAAARALGAHAPRRPAAQSGARPARGRRHPGELARWPGSGAANRRRRQPRRPGADGRQMAWLGDGRRPWLAGAARRRALARQPAARARPSRAVDAVRDDAARPRPARADGALPARGDLERRPRRLRQPAPAASGRAEPCIHRRPGPTITVPAGRYRALCDGRTFDWIEARP